MLYTKGMFIHCYECTLKRLKDKAKESIDGKNRLAYFTLTGDVRRASAEIVKDFQPVWQVHIHAEELTREIPEEDRGLFFIVEYRGAEYTPDMAKLLSKPVIKRAAELTGRKWYLSRVMVAEENIVSVFYAAEGSGAMVIDEVGKMAYHGCTREWRSRATA